MAKQKKRWKILVIDDEPTLCNALRDKLTQANFDVRIAHNGSEGLEQCGVERPDLILLDLLMPEMDGIQFLKSLRALASGQEIPVFILTNLNEPDKMQGALKYGAYDFFIKSDWPIDEIVKKVAARLKKI